MSFRRPSGSPEGRPGKYVESPPGSNGGQTDSNVRPGGMLIESTSGTLGDYRSGLGILIPDRSRPVR
jgi:hypothetical protein